MLIVALALLVIGALLVAQRTPRKARLIDHVRKYAGTAVLICGVVVFVGELV